VIKLYVISYLYGRNGRTRDREKIFRSQSGQNSSHVVHVLSKPLHKLLV